MSVRGSEIMKAAHTNLIQLDVKTNIHIGHLFTYYPPI